MREIVKSSTSTSEYLGRWIVAVIRLIFIVIPLSWWLRWVFLAPLKEEAWDMVRRKDRQKKNSTKKNEKLIGPNKTRLIIVGENFVNPNKHKRQLDPTEIVLIPIPLERLFYFVGVVVGVTLILSSMVAISQTNNKFRGPMTTLIAKHLLDKVVSILELTGLLFLAMMICGASPYGNLGQTALASLYLASLIFIDLPTDDKNPDDFGDKSILERISPTFTLELSDHKKKDDGILYKNSQKRIRAHCVMGITVCSQILLLYDRGWQVQRWPAPTVLGSTIGWIIGTASATLLTIWNESMESPRSTKNGPQIRTNA